MTHSFPVVPGRWRERDGSVVQIVRDLGRRIAARGREAPRAAATPLWRSGPPRTAAGRGLRGVIVVVAWDAELAAALAQELVLARYETHVAHRTRGAHGEMEAARDGLAADAVLVAMRPTDGRGEWIGDVLRCVPASGDVPILVCSDGGPRAHTAVVADGVDELASTTAGLRAFVVRLGAILRRCHAGAAVAPTLAFGRLRVDVVASAPSRTA